MEMAFALPILALIFLSMIDLGLMIRQYQVLQNAAREGARISIYLDNQIFYHTPPCAASDAIKQRVVNYCQEEGIVIGLADVTVNQLYPLDPGGGDYGSEITVSYTRPMLLVGAPFLPTNSLTLTGRSVFANFYGRTSTTYPSGVTCQ